MKELTTLLSELGISKVRLAKYLGVSRQMLYNYLALGDINKWPKEKTAKLLSLLNVDKIDNLKDKEITGEYIIEVENRLNEGVKDTSDKDNLLSNHGGIFSNVKDYIIKHEDEIKNLLESKINEVIIEVYD